MSTNWIVDEFQKEKFEISKSRINFSLLYDYPNCISYKYASAIYLDLCANEKKRYFWQFYVSSGNYVGITKEKSISAGKTISGCFFDEDLFDGYQVVLSKLGEISNRMCQVIGFILDLTEEELKVYIVQNDRPLGLAYVQKAPYSKEIYPAFIFTEPDSARVYEINDVNIDNLLMRWEYPKKSINGQYILEKAVYQNKKKGLLPYRIKVTEDLIQNLLYFEFKYSNWFDCFFVRKDSVSNKDSYKVLQLLPFFEIHDSVELKCEKYIFRILKETQEIKFDKNFKNIKIISTRGILRFTRFSLKQDFNITDVLK